MSCRAMLGLSCVLLAIACTSAAAELGPGEAAGGSRSGRAVEPRANRADFIVLVWYRRDDPLGTFKYQTYDARKGEYTAEVDRWIKEIRTKFPAYLVLVRPVVLASTAGATESLKVGSVIHRELLIAAAQSGVFLGEPLKISPGPTSGRQGSVPRPGRLPGSMGSDRSYLNPPPTLFPVPVPYPRPHP